MKTMRLIAAVAAGVLSVFCSPAAAQTEVENAQTAVNGLQAFGRLLKQLTAEEGDFDSQLDAVAAFVKPLAAEMALTEDWEEATTAYIDGAVEAIRERQQLQQEMASVAAAIDAGAAGEELEGLRKKMRDLMEAHNHSVLGSLASVFKAMGAPEEEAKQMLQQNPTLLVMISIVQGVGQYYRYL